MLNRLSLASILMLSALFLTLPSSKSPASELKVVASIKPIHSLVSSVMAGVGEPTLIIRGATSPHTFNLCPSDARHLTEADVIFVVGEDIESSLVRHLNALTEPANVVHLTETPGLQLLDFRTDEDFADHENDGHEDHDDHGHDDHGHDDHGHDDHGHDDHGHDDHGHDDHGHDDHHGHAHGEFDPHLWTDPAIAELIAMYVAEKLGEKDPANAARYTDNAAQLIERLRELDAEVADILAPIKDRPYIVFHDAYQYFEVRYGLNSVATILLRPEQPPSANRLRAMRELIAETGTICVFSEPQFPADIVDVIIEDTSVRSGVLDPIGAFLENGPELYFMLIRTMASSLRTCLEGS
ncbi:MAG: zinc ABC transporter substrate-binding protein [Rhodobacteraceae bacterium]|nr:zinc ABC transporter substrate-binding protein [Paracoccaceae bacterium]